MRQNFKIPAYNWNTIIYYTINDTEAQEIKDMLGEDCSDTVREFIVKNLDERTENTGFVYSNYSRHYSIVVIHKASSIGEFINTFEHEKNHLEMHICETYGINPYSEEAAHLSGHLAQLIIEKALSTITSI